MNSFSHAISAPSRSTKPRTPLIFPDIYNSWFKGKERLKIGKIEHRKEFDRPFFHEFILVQFDNNSQYRFDRRPDRTQAMDALLNGARAEDTVEEVTNINDPHYVPSECIAALDFKDHCIAGLSLILAVCAAISRDEKAGLYTLREFNCYFFSWTIIAAVARYCVAWESLPYDSNFLCLPENKLSQAIAQGVANELVSILPRSLSSALTTSLPKMLIVNILEYTSLPLEYMDMLCGDYLQRIRLSLCAEPFKSNLSRILQHQCHIITQALRSDSNRGELQNAIESLVRQASSQSSLDPEDLSVILRSSLWRSDIIHILSSNMEERTAQWCTLNNIDQIVGGPAVWECVSNIITSWLSKEIQASISSQIVEQVVGIVGDALDVAKCTTLAGRQELLVRVMSSVRNVIDASISAITDCNVCYAVGLVRRHMKVTQGAIKDSIIHTVDNLFPDELPIGLRIPKARNSRFRQLPWLAARPESAFCLWRTPREIQNCSSIKHRELQKYLSRRIHAHSRDVKVLGAESIKVETSIREAMSRVWLAGSREIEGLNMHRDKKELENGRILLLPTPEEEEAS